ncbi:alpha/beta hydrolase [Aliikangiella sp. G2MR2-5]|uniref:alpha/beta hydrolase n=1 Tax=Aliikangiella sp. G2MR2-5 TaxID=2788943 RepID=UPI0018AACA28|nr:alpha/beta fold hydrolase [Aliikangiella sp. G2MR2-5]
MKLTSEKVTIAGPDGTIEALLDMPENLSSAPYFSVNCHPHSLHGGSLSNKVVHTLSRTIAGLGFPSIRFNFRGVGNSEGKYDEGRGEQQDLEFVIKWMQQKFPDKKLILSGFSFGAYVSSFASPRLRPELLISVAPPVKRFDFNGFVRPDCDWRIIMGDDDELVDYSEVVEWVKLFEKTPSMITMKGASHFFHGRLVELRSHIEEIVSHHVNLSSKF